ncbi:hypothetical protein pb186bvf_008717 [Paramecium bursaria]
MIIRRIPIKKSKIEQSPIIKFKRKNKNQKQKLEKEIKTDNLNKKFQIKSSENELQYKKQYYFDKNLFIFSPINYIQYFILLQLLQNFYRIKYSSLCIINTQYIQKECKKSFYQTNINESSIRLHTASCKLRGQNLKTNFYKKDLFSLDIQIDKSKTRALKQEDLDQLTNDYSSKTSYERYMKNYEKNKGSKLSVRSALFQTFKVKIILTFVLYIVIYLLLLGIPLMQVKGQEYFIYENPDDKPSLHSLLVFSGIQFLYLFFKAYLTPISNQEYSILNVQLQGALSQHIFKKTLSFPLQRSSDYSSGDLINMLQVDVNQASKYFQNAYQLYIMPVFFVIICIVYFDTVGMDSIPSGVGAIIQALLGFVFGYYYGKIQARLMHAKDVRMSYVDESLLYAKQIKLNCLQGFFEKRIQEKRDIEIQCLNGEIKMLLLLRTSQVLFVLFCWEATFYFSQNLGFQLIALLFQNYANLLQILADLPMQIKNFKNSQNSLKRITKFFEHQEIEQLMIGDQQDENAINVKDGQFTWEKFDKQEKIFKIYPTLQIKKGKIIAIVGNSASGKTSILKSLLGEMKQEGGSFQINGKISISTQEPWIISGTIKENITYMEEYNQQRYQEVINICQLNIDIKKFKNGHETILSEKGDNLSGGQQKRINIARCVYRQADIYIFDDPLSSLDIKIQIKIQQQCIENFLQGKTRIVFTNSFSNLSGFDQIYTVNDGVISEYKSSNNQPLNQIVVQEQKQYKIDEEFEKQKYPTEGSNNDQEDNNIQNEDQVVGNIDKRVVQQIYQFQGGCWAIIITFFYFLIILFCQVIGNGLMASDDVWDERYKGMTYYVVISLPIGILQITTFMYFLYKGLKTSKFIHSAVISNLLKASYTKFYNTILIGRLMNRLSKDIYNIDLLFPSELNNLTISITSLLIPLLTSLLYLNYYAFPLLIVFLIILAYLTQLYYRCLREVTRIESVSKSPVFNFYQQIVRGITFVRTCLNHQKLLDRQTQNIDLDLSNQITLNGLINWFQINASIITTVFQTILFIICFLFPGSQQKLNYLILLQMSSFQQILLNFTLQYGNVLMYTVSFERCLHLANNIEIEQDEALIKDHKVDKIQDQSIIEFQNCDFYYKDENKKVLKSMDIQIHKYDKIGIVGRTGAGKSSIILALTRMLEQSDGSLLINNIDIRTKTLTELRTQFSIIPQDPLVFQGTLRENLDPKVELGDDELLQACEQCNMFNLDSFKQNIELQTQIISNGGNLSQGEKQLLAIVRCLLENRDIILIDEATASIDGPTEQLVKEVFLKNFQQKTVITIAHKITTIMNSDMIMVLNDGQVLEYDTPQSLMQKPNSEFNTIVNLIKQSEQL